MVYATHVISDGRCSIIITVFVYYNNTYQVHIRMITI